MERELFFLCCAVWQGQRIAIMAISVKPMCLAEFYSPVCNASSGAVMLHLMAPKHSWLITACRGYGLFSLLVSFSFPMFFFFFSRAEHNLFSFALFIFSSASDPLVLQQATWEILLCFVFFCFVSLPLCYVLLKKSKI